MTFSKEISKDPTRFISAHVSGDLMWIDMMSVPKSERGKGAGKVDYLAWEKNLPENVKLVKIFASDTGDGHSAVFWEKMGFEYQYEGENLDYETANCMWKGVNGHATPPTVDVDVEAQEEAQAMERAEKASAFVAENLSFPGIPKSL